MVIQRITFRVHGVCAVFTYAIQHAPNIHMIPKNRAHESANDVTEKPAEGMQAFCVQKLRRNER